MQFVLSGFVIIILQGGMLASPLAMISWNTVPLKLVVMFLVVCSGFVVFELTPFGKMGRAAGSCMEAARLSGVNITLIKFVPFIISGTLAGMLGFFSLIRTGTASNHTGADLLMDVLNAVLLGGIPISGGANTRFQAVIIGSLTMTILANGMSMLGFDSFDRQLIKGIVFIVAIALSVDRRNIVVIK
jgi:ribose transport system permease protein